MGSIPVGDSFFLCPMLVSCRLIHLPHVEFLFAGNMQHCCSQPSFLFPGLLHVDAGGRNSSPIESENGFQTNRQIASNLCLSIW